MQQRFIVWEMTMVKEEGNSHFRLIIEREVNAKKRKEGLGSFAKRMRDEGGAMNKARVSILINVNSFYKCN